MTSYLPWITGPLGALVILAIVAFLLGTGKLHSDDEFQKLAAENKDLKAALETERTTNNELARAGGVTNKLIGALVDVATDRHGEHPSQHSDGRRADADLTPEDLGLLAVRPWRRLMRILTVEDTLPPREAEVSRERQEQLRREVVEPLRQLGDRNRFAELIRASLVEGHQSRRDRG
jgi:hypothetical protein